MKLVKHLKIGLRYNVVNAA